MSSSHYITIEPIPSSNVSLLNTSNADTLNDIVTVGELSTFLLNVSLPEGTTMDATFSLRTTLTTGFFAIQRVTPVYSSNIFLNNLNTIFSTTTFRDDTVTIITSSIVNEADNILDERDNLFFYIECMPLPVTPSGTVATLSTVFSHTHNNSRPINEDARVATVTIMQPELSLTHNCTPETADAIDQVTCYVDVFPIELLVCEYKNYVIFRVLIFCCSQHTT